MPLREKQPIEGTKSVEAGDLSGQIQKIRDRLISRGDTEVGPLSEKLKLVDQLSQFDYGRQLLLNGGLNGRWSHYAFYEFPRLKARGVKFHPLEERLLTAPGLEANRERIAITQSLIKPELFDGIRILSVPCGVMAELSSLDFSGITNFNLVGVDVDPESIALAKEFAKERGIVDKCEFLQRDAWDLGFESQFDRILSLGLNIYSSSLQVALDLYRSLHRALKPGGKLAITYVTPQLTDPRSERDPSLSTPEGMRFTRLFIEVVQAKFENHSNTSEEIVQNLCSVGFKSVTCHHSRYRSTNIAYAVK